LGYVTRRNSFKTTDGRWLRLRPFHRLDAPALLEFANAMFDEKKVNRDLGIISFDRRPTVAEGGSSSRSLSEG